MSVSRCHTVTLSRCHTITLTGSQHWEKLCYHITPDYFIRHQLTLNGYDCCYNTTVYPYLYRDIAIIVTLLLSWHCYYRDIAIIVTWFICCLISVNFLTAVNLTIGEESENCLSEPSSVPLSAHSSVPPSAHSTISRPESLDDAPCSSDSKPGRSLQTDQLKLNLGLINESSAEKAAASGKKCFLSIVWDMLYHRKF